MTAAPAAFGASTRLFPIEHSDRDRVGTSFRGDLQADVASADYHKAPATECARPQFCCVRQTPQAQHAVEIGARNRQLSCPCPGGEDQHLVLEDGAVVHGHLMAADIDTRRRCATKKVDVAGAIEVVGPQVLRVVLAEEFPR